MLNMMKEVDVVDGTDATACPLAMAQQQFLTPTRPPWVIMKVESFMYIHLCLCHVHFRGIEKGATSLQPTQADVSLSVGEGHLAE